MTPAKINYKIYQGTTFRETFRWESQTKGYANISGITKTAPCVITTQNNHTIPINWRIRVVGAGGMKELNIVSEEDYHLVTAVTGNTLTLNQVNSTNYTAYTTGGVIEYNVPIPLVGYSAQMQIRETVDSNTTILELTNTNGGIILDTTNYTISISIAAAQTRAFTFPTAVYSLELTDSSGVVTTLVTGNLTLVQEVTR
jgi:hypothetical protein